MELTAGEKSLIECPVQFRKKTEGVLYLTNKRFVFFQPTTKKKLAVNHSSIQGHVVSKANTAECLMKVPRMHAPDYISSSGSELNLT